MKIAKVNKNTDKIISIVFEKSIPVTYQKQLEHSQDNIFNKEIMDQGIKAIKTLKEIADQHQVKKVVAVATAAFRQAKNSSEFVKEIKKETGVDVNVISQHDEGLIAFQAALAKSPIPESEAVVWDIGGGSLQLTSLSGHDSYHVDKGTIASAAFKNYIIEKIQGKDLKAIHTPNPMSVEEVKQAIDYSQKIASDIVSNYMKNKIKQPSTKVLAVGNLFYFGIREFLGGNPNITQEQLETAIMSAAGKTDTELGGGSFAEVALSNAILVHGYMKALGIHSLTILDVNNADGALTYTHLWE